MADRKARTRLIGRERELGELERRLDAVREGRPSIVLVEGPAGIGKTALVDRFLSGREDVRIVRASGARWESDHPFGVAEQLVRGSGEITPLPRSVEWDDPLVAGRRLLESWGSSAEVAPVVAVVDDTHWADIQSLHALSCAVRRMTTEKVLVILVVSDDYLADLPAAVVEFLSGYRGDTVRVRPLEADDVQALATQCAGVDLSAPAAQRLCEHTGGNPLYIGQLLQEVPATDWAEWQPLLPAPRLLAAAVVRTLASCSSPARALVQSAAALGQTSLLSEATQVAGIDEPVRALDEAHRAGLLSIGQSRGLTVVTFRNPLVQAAVYADLGPLRRQELHQRAAEIVGEEGQRLMHRVAATPFADADLADELVEFSTRRAAVGAWPEVAEALITASRLSLAKADRETRLVRAVDALLGAGDLPRAVALVPEIESLRESALRDAALGYLAILRGRPAEADLFLTRAWALCNPARDPDTAALICQRRVLHSLGRWRGPDLVDWVRRAVELAGPDDPAAVESEAIVGLGLAAMGRVAEARSAYADLATRVTSGAQSQRVHMGKGWLDLALDDPETARRELAGAVPTVYRMGSARISLWAQAWLARAEFALGAWDDAVQTVNRAATQVENTGMELIRPLVHWTGAQTHALRGNWDAAAEHLQRGSATPQNYEVMLIPSCLARAQCAEARADYETVIRSLDPLVQLHPRQGLDEPGFWPWHDVYANALVMTNRVDDADAFLTPYEELAAERAHRSGTARLGYVRGRIAGARGDIEAAKVSFEGALLRLEGLPLPYEWARVNFAYGQTLRRAGKRREADVVLHNARDAYAALGARAYVQRCDRELKAGGLNVKRPSLDFARLTTQEQAVAKLVAAGMSNREVGVELFLAVKTVQFHLTRIYSKLGIRSRSELAARFRAESGENEG